jgi:hypothetical protein
MERYITPKKLSKILKNPGIQMGEAFSCGSLMSDCGGELSDTSPKPRLSAPTLVLLASHDVIHSGKCLALRGKTSNKNFCVVRAMVIRCKILFTISIGDFYPFFE